MRWTHCFQEEPLTLHRLRAGDSSSCSTSVERSAHKWPPEQRGPEKFVLPSFFDINKQLCPQHPKDWCCCSVTKLVWLCATPWTEQRLPGSSIHRILQARILERVAMPSSRGSSQPRDRTHVSYISCVGRQVLNTRATWEASPAVAKWGPWGSGPRAPELGSAPGKLGVLPKRRARLPSAFMSLRQHCWGHEHFPQENDSQLFQARRPTTMTQQRTANSIHSWCLFSPEVLSLRVKVYHTRSPLTYFWSPGRWERWEIVWKRLMSPQAVFPGTEFSPFLFASPPA